MLTANYVNSYPKNGRMQFVFKVKGNTEEKEQYLALQRARYPKSKWVDADGEPLYWTNTPSGETIKLKITTKGNIVEDTGLADIKAVSQARHDYIYEAAKAGFITRAERAGASSQAVLSELTPEISVGEDSKESID